MPSNKVLEDVRLVFRNFSGRPGKYNKEGDLNFGVILDKPTAKEMLKEGWNVKQFKPSDEDPDPDHYILVSLRYDRGRPPRVTMLTSTSRTELDGETIDILDTVDIKTVDLVLRPYEWEVQDKHGIKAYLKSMYVTIDEDVLDRKYADEPEED